MRIQKIRNFCFLDHVYLGLYLKDMAVIVIFFNFSEFFFGAPSRNKTERSTDAVT